LRADASSVCMLLSAKSAKIMFARWIVVVDDGFA
jgi:hypothetical protein